MDGVQEPYQSPPLSWWYVEYPVEAGTREETYGSRNQAEAAAVTMSHLAGRATLYDSAGLVATYVDGRPVTQ